MNKEEILEAGWQEVGSLVTDAIHAAWPKITEYAKQDSIGFAEWSSENGWEKHTGENTWFNRMGYITEYTTEQLYELYISQQQNKIQ